MEGNSTRTTRQPVPASPLAIAAMNGLSIPSPAPWARSTVTGATSVPSINRGAGWQALTPPRQRPGG
jgi:hypothetical protein